MHAFQNGDAMVTKNFEMLKSSLPASALTLH